MYCPGSYPGSCPEGASGYLGGRAWEDLLDRDYQGVLFAISHNTHGRAAQPGKRDTGAVTPA